MSVSVSYVVIIVATPLLSMGIATAYPAYVAVLSLYHIIHIITLQLDFISIRKSKSRKGSDRQVIAFFTCHGSYILFEYTWNLL